MRSSFTTRSYNPRPMPQKPRLDMNETEKAPDKAPKKPPPKRHPYDEPEPLVPFVARGDMVVTVRSKAAKSIGRMDGKYRSAVHEKQLYILANCVPDWFTTEPVVNERGDRTLLKRVTGLHPNYARDYEIVAVKGAGNG